MGYGSLVDRSLAGLESGGELAFRSAVGCLWCPIQHLLTAWMFSWSVSGVVVRTLRFEDWDVVAREIEWMSHMEEVSLIWRTNFEISCSTGIVGKRAR